MVQGGETIRAWTPTVKVVDSCGAGSTYSAGSIYGRLRGWSLEETIRFVTAAAAIQCTLVGIQVSPIADVLKMASEQVRIERPWAGEVDWPPAEASTPAQSRGCRLRSGTIRPRERSPGFGRA